MTLMISSHPHSMILQLKTATYTQQKQKHRQCHSRPRCRPQWLLGHFQQVVCCSDWSTPWLTWRWRRNSMRRSSLFPAINWPGTSKKNYSLIKHGDSLAGCATVIIMTGCSLKSRGQPMGINSKNPSWWKYAGTVILGMYFHGVFRGQNWATGGH